MTYLFVGGSERSGTSLLHSILCSDDTANPLIAEAMLFRFLVEAYRNGKPHFEAKGSDYFNDFDAYRTFHASTAERFLEMTRRRYAPAKYLVLKEPTLTRTFPELFELLPQAKFILIVRDPRDTVCSLIKVSRHIEDSRHPLFRAADDMRRLSRFYHSFYRYALGYDDPEYRNRLCVIKYEDLIFETSSTIERLRSFSGLKLGEFDANNPWANGVRKDASLPWQSDLWGKALSPDRVGIYKSVLGDDQILTIERECAGYLKHFDYKTHEPGSTSVNASS